jgi:hypothetical protein
LTRAIGRVGAFPTCEVSVLRNDYSSQLFSAKGINGGILKWLRGSTRNAVT